VNWSLAAFTCCATLATSVAHASDAHSRHTDESDDIDGTAELGVGVLSLPTAEVCSARETGRCREGDTSLMLEVWQLFRVNHRFAAGAGITLGLFPTTDAPRSDPEGVTRNHSRGYLTAEGIARIFFLQGPPWEGWVGATGGLVVVSDTYSPRGSSSDRALVGPRGVTTRTEGYTLGLATGVAYEVATDLNLGLSLRYGLWSLPTTPAKNTLGDEASLTGRNSTLLVGVSVGYRVRL